MKRRNTRAPDGAPLPVDAYVGNRIRLQRSLLGMSQEELGHRINLTFQQVQKYEKGLNRVSASRLHEIAIVLDVAVAFFFPVESASGDAYDLIESDAEIALLRAYKRIVNQHTRKKLVSLAVAIAAGGLVGSAEEYPPPAPRTRGRPPRAGATG